MKIPRWTDNDNDGFGDVGATATTCFAPMRRYMKSMMMGDGILPYVECSLSEGPGWQGAVIIDGNDCDDTDSNHYEIQEWYLDFDGDGFGNALFPIDACGAPANYIADNTDCLDSDDTVFPNAPELCDGSSQRLWCIVGTGRTRW